MHKTLHNSFSSPSGKEGRAMCPEDTQQLAALMKEMKQYFRYASRDLLQPSQKSVARILRKALQEQQP